MNETPPIFRHMSAFVLPAALGLAAAVLVSCGDSSDGGKLLSPTTAAELRATLVRVERMVDDGDCDGAASQTAALRDQIGSLPKGVDPDLRVALSSGAGQLQSLVNDRCEPVPPVTTAPPTEPPPTETEPPVKKEDKPKKPKEDEGKANGNGQNDDQESGGAPPGDQGGVDDETGGVTP